MGRLLTTIGPAKLWSSSTVASTSAESSRHDSTSRSIRSTNGRQTCCHRVSSATSCSPRPTASSTTNQIDKWTTNLLPSRQFGYVVLTTSDGIIDHEEAKKKHTGGKILGFFF